MQTEIHFVHLRILSSTKFHRNPIAVGQNQTDTYANRYAILLRTLCKESLKETNFIDARKVRLRDYYAIL